MFGNDYYDPVTDQVRPMLPSSLAWPALLAQHLGQDLDNHAVVGGSNSRIFRRAVADSCGKQYSVIICAWTQLSRIDISYQGRECPAAANNPKWPWIKNYFADHYEDRQEQERLLAHMLALQSYFKAQGQRYRFIKSMYIQFLPDLAYLHDQLDQTQCVAWSSDMMQLCRGLPQGPHGHFLEAGHALVADVIYQHLTAV
jgi:hypothetical protein